MNNCSLLNFGLRSSWRHMAKQQTGRSHQINPCTCIFYRVFSELRKIETHLCLDISLKAFLRDLTRSLSPHCFPLNTDESSSDTPLSVHHVNWASAEDNMDIVQDLVREEISHVVSIAVVSCPTNRRYQLPEISCVPIH